MQLVLILGLVFALLCVMFALQNDVPVTVTLLVWRFDGSLAVVLLVALALGAFVAALVSSPAMIRGNFAKARQRRAISALESEQAANARRIGELEAELAGLRPSTASDAPKAPPYVGLKTLIASGGKDDKPAR